MKALLILPAFLLIASFYSCNGIFPSEPKSNVPDDHNNNYGGAMHKRVDDAGDCEECHGNDLRGRVYNYNGTLIVTSSCYQCHGNIWEGRGDKKFPGKNK
jgi:hypothetical protein